MVKKILAPVFSVVLLLNAVDTFAQAGNGQVTGVVQDATKALVPGVTITLSNTNTGITNTQVTNESGVYTFQSVPPGIYNVSAALPGFKTSVTSGVQVSLVPVRVNITLEVGALDNKVEVISAADAVLAETSASVGVVLPERRVAELPMVGGNVLDLLSVLPKCKSPRVRGPTSSAEARCGMLKTLR
jgi:carboxypeptidase family protein